MESTASWCTTILVTEYSGPFLFKSEYPKKKDIRTAKLATPCAPWYRSEALTVVIDVIILSNTQLLLVVCIRKACCWIQLGFGTRRLPEKCLFQLTKVGTSTWRENIRITPEQVEYFSSTLRLVEKDGRGHADMQSRNPAIYDMWFAERTTLYQHIIQLW